MPCDLNADTYQQEGDDAQHALSEGGWYLFRSEGRVCIEDKDHEAQENNAAEESQKCTNPIGKLKALRLGAQRQHHGDGARTYSYGERERIKHFGLPPIRDAILGGWPEARITHLLFARRLVEQLLPHRCKNHSANQL